MPEAIIVEDVTLTRFAHREAIHFLLVIELGDKELGDIHDK